MLELAQEQARQPVREQERGHLPEEPVGQGRGPVVLERERRGGLESSGHQGAALGRGRVAVLHPPEGGRWGPWDEWGHQEDSPLGELRGRQAQRDPAAGHRAGE